MVNFGIKLKYFSPATPPSEYIIRRSWTYQLGWDRCKNQFFISDGNKVQYIENYYMLTHMFVPLNEFHNWYEFRRWFEEKYKISTNIL